MSARATSERMVYAVPSKTIKGRDYRVDLLANGGRGRCSCTDFSTRRQPAIDRGGPMLTRATTCKHLREAIRSFLTDLLPKMAAMEDKKP